MRVAIVNTQSIKDRIGALSLYALYKALEHGGDEPLIFTRGLLPHELTLRCGAVAVDTIDDIPTNYRKTVDGAKFAGLYVYIIKNDLNTDAVDFEFIDSRIAEIARDNAAWLRTNITDRECRDVSPKNIARRSRYIDCRIQNLLFPDCEWKDEHIQLMCRGDALRYDAGGDKSDCWSLAEGFVEFFTYFNSLSVRKWNRYTNAENYSLHLTVKGRFSLRFFGHWLEPSDAGASGSLDGELDKIRELDISDVEKQRFVHKCIFDAKPRREEFSQHRFDTEGRIEEIVLPAEYINSSVLGFSLSTEDGFAIYDGYWSASCEESLLNDVNISMCITTFRKEDYIVSNIRDIEREIFDSENSDGTDGLAGHLYINVADNGRTLDRHNMNGSNIRVHYNPNTGGAGGFTRGMMETLKLRESGEFAATHVLFMDDDVKILPESLKRTYAFLRLIRDGYKDHFVSGAMLKLEKMNIQVEDIGYVSPAVNFWRPQKPLLDLNVWDIVLRNEENFDMPNQYAAWWYCVVPMRFIRPDNLSLPLFFRTDDIEFSLRNKIKAITLNGVALWHMSGESKYNPVVDKYLNYRNTLFIRATSGIADGCDFLSGLESQFMQEIRCFNYTNAEFLARALEDFLKGPKYFATADWEAVIKELSARKEKYRPIEDFKNINFDMNTLNQYVPLDKFDMELFIDSDNGHKLSDAAPHAGVGVIPYSWMENPGRQFLRRYILAVNPHEKTAVLREIDKERYATVMKRYSLLKSRYEKDYDSLAGEYRGYAATFTSESFWRGYLGARRGL